MSVRYPQYPPQAVSVTELLSFYYPPSEHYTERSRNEGKALHACCQYLAEGDLDGASVEPLEVEYPGFKARLKRYERFLEVEKPQTIVTEKALYSPSLGICGTLDWGGRVRGRLAIIDYKRGAFAKRFKLQTALYKILAAESGLPFDDRYTLHLDADPYHLEPHEDAEDEECARALVAGFFAKEQYC